MILNLADDIKCGNTQVDAVYCGDVLVWPQITPSYDVVTEDIMYGDSSSSSYSFILYNSGDYRVLQIIINMGDSTEQMTSVVTVDGEPISGGSIKFYEYNETQENPINARIFRYSLTAEARTVGRVELSNMGLQCGYIAAVISSGDFTKVAKALSTKNGATSGAFNQDGIVVYGVYGYVSSIFSPHFTIEKYTANTTVTTQSGAVSFIYWLR